MQCAGGTRALALQEDPVGGTHKGHQCQEGVRTWPGDYACRRAGLTVLLDPSSQLPGSSCRAAGGSGWSARSRAAARTNELDAGKRRKIIGGGEGFVCGLAYAGSRAGSRCVAGGVVSQAPIRRRASVRAAAMTMCPGPGCSVRRPGAALAPAHAAGASAPGAWRPSRLHGRRGGSFVLVACMSASRCQARVSSLRAIAMVAILVPRRWAMAA
jgi:hypothetical protein